MRREKLSSRVVVDEFRPTVEDALDNEWLLAEHLLFKSAFQTFALNTVAIY